MCTDLQDWLDNVEYFSRWHVDWGDVSPIRWISFLSQSSRTVTFCHLIGVHSTTLCVKTANFSVPLSSEEVLDIMQNLKTAASVPVGASTMRTKYVMLIWLEKLRAKSKIRLLGSTGAVLPATTWTWMSEEFDFSPITSFSGGTEACGSCQWS